MRTGRGMAQAAQLRTPASGLLRRQVPLAQVWEEVVAQAAQTPWMVQSLMVQGRELASRVTAQYLRLRRLPRRIRRLLARRGALSLTSAALLLALAGPGPGWAGTTISVSSGSALATAITLANSQTGVYAGTNTLTLTANIAVESALDAVTSTIVIAGNGYEIVGSTGLSASIFTVASTGNLTVQDTTVTGGKGSKGGALYNSGTLTLTESTLSGNTVSHYGGALFNNKGTVILTSSTVSDNSAGVVGGGMYNAGGSVTLTSSTVTGNSAYYAGGVSNANSGTVVLTDSQVSNNSVRLAGGGILNSGGSVTVANSTVTGNAGHYFGGGIWALLDTVTVSAGSTVASNRAQKGGGIFVDREATAVLQNSTVSGNTATVDGGGIGVHYGTSKQYCPSSGIGCHTTVRFGGTLTMTYSTVSGNTTQGQGGGLDIGRYTSVTLENSTLSGNIASNNGGGLNAYPDGTDVYDGRSNITLSFCTLTGNTAGGEGGGISTGEHTDLTLSDTLVSGNHASSSGREVRTNTDHSTISFGHNNLFGYSGSSGLSGQGAGTSDIVPSASLSAILNSTLSDNGGYTDTHALVSGSPAINAASTSCPPPTLDQRGYGRPASGSIICDIGAYEFGATDTTVPAALSSGQATNVGSTQTTGSVQLSATTATTTTTASAQQLTVATAVPVGLDLSRASAWVPRVLVEGGRELVAGLDVSGVELHRLEGAKKDRASFATAAGVQPKMRLQVQIKQGVLQLTLRVDQAVVARPLLCGDDKATELESELVLSDGKLPSVRLQLGELWQCQTRRDGRITGLVAGNR